jgi:hypothetical protein
MSFTTRARQQGGVTSPAMARAAAVAAEINRAQTPAPVGPVTRAGKKDDEFFDKNKDAEPKIDPLVDDKDDDDKKDPKKKKSHDDEGFVELQSAGSASGDGKPGSAGGFTPMPGSLDAFDDNDDKGDTSAPNDTGKPKTPSGI